MPAVSWSGGATTVSLMGDGAVFSAAIGGTIGGGVIGLVADRSPVSAEARCSNVTCR